MEWNKKWFGFWSEDGVYVNTPSVMDWIDSNWWTERDKSQFCDYLEDGVVLSVSRARQSKCHICGHSIEPSFALMSDGVWIWNNFLIHYVQEHSIRLPDEFSSHIASSDFIVSIPHIENEERYLRSMDWSMFEDGGSKFLSE